MKRIYLGIIRFFSLKRAVFIFCFLFVLINGVVFFQAYRFTHFDNSSERVGKESQTDSFLPKLKAFVFGIDNPKPKSLKSPDQSFEVIKLKAGVRKSEGWFIPVENSKGTVILFHGVSAEKSSLLDESKIFRSLGYNTFLVDLIDQKNNQVTMGFYESDLVVSAFEFVKNEKLEKNIFLFGRSMGAAAVMKAMSERHLDVRGIILECPFGNMLQAAKSRFGIMGLPSFPLANMLVFWGGLQNGFNAFAYSPKEYAKNITVPALLLYGKKDDRVTSDEIGEIFKNLNGTKNLKIYEKSGHESFLLKNKKEWKQDISDFFDSFLSD